MTAEAHEHRAEAVCQAGLQLYARALREGTVPEYEAAAMPCVTQSGILQPDVEDVRRLRPLLPALALPRLLHRMEEDIARRRRAESWLTEAFEPLLTLGTRDGHGLPATDGITVLHGIDRINDAIGRVTDEASQEILTIQPGGRRSPAALAVALPREQRLLSCGARMRTLYQHTTRHDPAVLAHFEQLHGDIEVRTLDELPQRMLMLDRMVAFIPANKQRTLAVEIRHRPLVTYLGSVFDRLWHLATPMHPSAVHHRTLNGITPRQRAIAALLIEGHTDNVIAERLGMNVRTARVHIAKLAATLGSESRAQLGYLIGQSGILDPER
ncbi:helix-turn-helix transcriptional regulator [Streptomyces sp. M92]|uniref:helix-turn-helix transcriptional regulator n=1 Tax=Streptomyces sp. M92 TaxID=2944250 RepID=UPI00234B727A|nr:helix-turn-helix transcriptional regulator [Streptomyces sp. M92]WCN02221.1 helix-turn-helix transcriptional regulator [Streptomyces sp. M92]